MNLKRLLTTPIGRFFISVILGLGLATLFRKACTGKDCINFNGPVIDEINGKTYKFGEHCYKYELHPEKCDPLKKTVQLSSAEDVSPKGIFE
jgi:hypothetical protein